MVANRELSNLRSNIEAQTKKLLEKREEDIKSKLKSLENKLISLAERENRLRESIKDKDIELSSKQLEVSGLIDAMIAKKSDLSALSVDISSSRDEIVRLETQKLDLKAEVAALNDDIAVMIPERDKLLESIHHIKEEMNVLSGEISDINAESYALKIEKERELSILNSKLLSMRQDEALARKIIDKESRSLADRKLALDERERVLRIRETKANIQESAIQRNANLLDL